MQLKEAEKLKVWLRMLDFREYPIRATVLNTDKREASGMLIGVTFRKALPAPANQWWDEEVTISFHGNSCTLADGSGLYPDTMSLINFNHASKIVNRILVQNYD